MHRKRRRRRGRRRRGRRQSIRKEIEYRPVQTIRIQSSQSPSLSRQHRGDSKCLSEEQKAYARKAIRLGGL
jgi:hypothetical protein